MNERPPKMWEISLGINKYLQFIKTGEKTVEGRINQGVFKNIKVGDSIKFYNPKDAGDFVVCRVLEIQKFETFEDMLSYFGLKNLVPDSNSIKEAADLYRRIPGFEERCKDFGCLGIRISNISNEKTAI